ncbi:MAG TPA: TetR family transcriptional regulator, partial [Steroidobacteraceae bacterium]|nr:TetR family transcriptional regulator [Steroidobacteraceae bacterium]
MPKIVDHDRRRDEIALVACRVVAEYGFDQATIVRIAREAGYTTGMVAHYFDTKQEIIIAALRLILRRIEERLTAAAGQGEPELLALLTEALPVDATRFTECAFWTAFWGQVSADRRLKRINAWMHREYLR